MGTQQVSATGTPEELRAFTGRLIEDLDRLEELLASGEIEAAPIRIGAELELFLVDERCQPVKVGPRVLRSISDPRVTPELGAFNLEINTSPVDLGGTCLRDLEREMNEVLGVIRDAAAEHDARVAITGILPTLEARHASLEYMTPAERYARLNAAMTALRGGRYHVFIKGVDEITLEHETVMLEACNTSFQVHLQVDPARFARVYNLGLVAMAPLLAVATNSPLLFGRRLWRETRIALFQQSIDTRRPGSDQRVFAPRVDFGSGWVHESVLEIYRDDVARFRAVLAADLERDPPGETPRLRALQLFNGTVYRWLRPCYGVGGGRAHLRIENRVLPAGPTLVDQTANAALWYGLVLGLEDEIGDPRESFDFGRVRGNFYAASRLGLAAPIDWVEGAPVTARDLLLDTLLPVARRGLALGGFDPDDADRYLGIIEARATNRQTGSEWLLLARDALQTGGASPWARLTAALIERQADNVPVHEWTLPGPPPRTVADRLARDVGAHMKRDLVTVQETDSVDLAIHLMRWKRIRHLPIEDVEQRLVGLVTRSTLFAFLATADDIDPAEVPLSEIMQRDLVTATADRTVADIIRLMRARGISSIPIVEGDRLIGLVTERDFLSLATDALLGPEAV